MIGLYSIVLIGDLSKDSAFTELASEIQFTFL